MPIKKDINLLTAAIKPEKPSEFESWLKKGSFALLLLYIFAISGVYFYHFILVAKDRRLADQIKDKQGKIGLYSQEESLQNVVKKRLIALNQVFRQEKDRIGLAESLTRVKALAGDEITLGSVQLEAFGNQARVTGTVKSIVSFSDYLDRLIASEGKSNGFDNLTVTGFSYFEGSYKFDLALGIKD